MKNKIPTTITLKAKREAQESWDDWLENNSQASLTAEGMDLAYAEGLLSSWTILGRVKMLKKVNGDQSRLKVERELLIRVNELVDAVNALDRQAQDAIEHRHFSECAQNAPKDYMAPNEGQASEQSEHPLPYIIGWTGIGFMICFVLVHFFVWVVYG